MPYQIDHYLDLREVQDPDIRARFRDRVSEELEPWRPPVEGAQPTYPMYDLAAVLRQVMEEQP